MSYQVLARKWRPRSFTELMGQEHVVRALTGGLSQGRLHHAFLFTGTRGVGKTTIARIIAKALNCEQGISATPCGACSNCRDIDIGRFPDLLEIDAASRTKVDDTREILDNVLYAPARGRFKVYLIDEVHMLSTHSFNALLKTLEEPPEHVKFLLATTDPQKLPVTVLSRCLKFHLKRLTVPQISAQMQHILNSEGIEFELDAITELARGADGSMRDGLSLLDQALAFGSGTVQTEATLEMLGTLSRDAVLELIEALAEKSPVKLAEKLAALADFSGSYTQVLARLMECLHNLAFIQVLGAQALPGDDHNPRLQALAARISSDDVQIKYQFALLGAKEVASAPDAKLAFEMVMLRMMTFSSIAAPNQEPQGGAAPSAGPETSAGSTPQHGAASAHSTRAQTSAERISEAPVSAAPILVAEILPIPNVPSAVQAIPAPAIVPQDAEPATAARISPAFDTPKAAEPSAAANDGDPSDALPSAEELDEQLADWVSSNQRDDDHNDDFTPSLMPSTMHNLGAESVHGGHQNAVNTALRQIMSLPEASRWNAVALSLKLSPGPAREFVENALLRDWRDDSTHFTLQLTVDEAHRALASSQHVQVVCAALQQHFEAEFELQIKVEDADLSLSPASVAARKRAHAAQEFFDTIEQRPLIQALIEQLDAKIVPGSMQYWGERGATH